MLLWDLAAPKALLETAASCGVVVHRKFSAAVAALPVGMLVQALMVTYRYVSMNVK